MSGDSADTTIEQPRSGYLSEGQLKSAVSALKQYEKKRKSSNPAQKKNLLEADQENPLESTKIFVEVVFKNIPSNSKTYIHNVLFPHHWRLQIEPEECSIAIFVRHRKPENEAEKIQFAKDRDLDLENTHSYYKDLFQTKLDENLRSRISRIISIKELATEFNTFKDIDRLSKSYDLFLSDKQLMANKLNPLPRRLGRRFWVREKKVPVMVKLEASNLNERFNLALSTEPFYVLGRSSTEQLQIGLFKQSNNQLVENLKAFLGKLFELYGDGVRFIRLRTNLGASLPIYADLTTICPKVTMRTKKKKVKPVTDEFDMLNGDAKISVHPDGTVRVFSEKRKRPSETANKSSKRTRQSA